MAKVHLLHVKTCLAPVLLHATLENKDQSQIGSDSSICYSSRAGQAKENNIATPAAGDIHLQVVTLHKYQSPGPTEACNKVNI